MALMRIRSKLERSDMRVAIIGAGLAGATLAYELNEAEGFEVTIFEKSRGVGGRMSTRHGDSHEYDHGAQFFTARTESFAAFVQDMAAAGQIEQWQPKVVTLALKKKPYDRIWFEPHYVSTPRMNSLCKHLIGEQTVKRRVRITGVETSGDGQRLVDDQGEMHGTFDWVISTAPAEQTMAIMPEAEQDLSSIEFDPCFAVMIPWDLSLPNWHAAKVKESSIDWLCFNHQKPGRTSKASLLLLSTGDWARENYNDVDSAKQSLLFDLNELLDCDISDAAIHRWRYARTRKSLGQVYWQDTENQISACGDWCLGNTVEDAFLSAHAMAEQLIRRTQIDHELM
jgi:predicted NAD/FAD-dependent oxidoreductase